MSDPMQDLVKVAFAEIDRLQTADKLTDAVFEHSFESHCTMPDGSQWSIEIRASLRQPGIKA